MIGFKTPSTTIPPTTTTTTTTTSTTTTTTTESPITLSVLYLDVSGNIRLEGNSLTSLTEDIEFQVIRSDSHAYTSANCGTGEISNSNFFTAQTATIVSGSISGQSGDIFETSIGPVQSTKIDATTIVWSNTSSSYVTTNNTTVTSPVTGKNYLVTNIDTCTPV